MTVRGENRAYRKAGEDSGGDESGRSHAGKRHLPVDAGRQRPDQAIHELG